MCYLDSCPMALDYSDSCCLNKCLTISELNGSQSVVSAQACQATPREKMLAILFSRNLEMRKLTASNVLGYPDPKKHILDKLNS